MKKTSTKQNFFWSYEKRFFTKRFSAVLFLIGIALLISGLVTNYLYRGTIFYVSVPLIVLAWLFMIAGSIRFLYDLKLDFFEIFFGETLLIRHNKNNNVKNNAFFWNKEKHWFAFPMKVILYLVSLGIYTSSFFMLNFFSSSGNDRYFALFFILYGSALIVELMAIGTNDFSVFSFKGLWGRMFATMIITLAIGLPIIFLL